jgi:hypothetical protein
MTSKTERNGTEAAEAANEAATNAAPAPMGAEADTQQKSNPEPQRKPRDGAAAEPAKGAAGGCGEISAYLGPTIRGEVSRGEMFPAGRDAAIAGLAATVGRYPQVADLIVSGDDLPESRIKANTPGNLLHKKYCELAGTLNKRGG